MIASNEAKKCECGEEATKHISVDIDLPTLYLCEKCHLEFMLKRYSPDLLCKNTTDD